MHVIIYMLHYDLLIMEIFLPFQYNLSVGGMSDYLHILHMPISYQVIYQKKRNAEKVLQLMQFWKIGAQNDKKGKKNIF